MKSVLAELTKHPVKTRLSLNGPLIVARDLAHSRLRERLNAGEKLPDYFKQYPIYYAGPAKTPKGYASGSFGPVLLLVEWMYSLISFRKMEDHWLC